MSDYMTFQDASEFLNTPRSTLYRWVREGRVPGHKLGRQWRFLREELEEFRASGAGATTFDALEPLGDFLKRRASDDETFEEEHEMENWKTPAQLAEHLLWDAVDHGAEWVHLRPDAGGHEIRYRTSEGLEELAQLPAEAFEALDREWRQGSLALRNDDSRRLVIERPTDAEPERVQVRYTRLETSAGHRLSLRLLREDRIRTDLADIVDDAAQLETLRRWSRASHGIVVVAGGSSSGKTTTAYACLTEASRDDDRILFTIEDRHDFFLNAVNQVKIDMNDERAYRDAFTAIFDSDPDVLFIGATFAQRHLGLLWGTALNAAESGHLVVLQIEADSADDALDRLSAAVDRPVDDMLVGICWQQLQRDDEGRRFAEYELISGPLDAGED